MKAEYVTKRIAQLYIILVPTTFFRFVLHFFYLNGEYGNNTPIPLKYGGRRGRDRMVVGFMTTYAISACHH
jgi:hypothetical protein